MIDKIVAGDEFDDISRRGKGRRVRVTHVLRERQKGAPIRIGDRGGLYRTEVVRHEKKPELIGRVQRVSELTLRTIYTKVEKP